MKNENQTYQSSLSAVFKDKPELIIDLPDWMLSAEQVDAYRNTKNLAIVEIAGRDSVAAAVKCVEDQGFSDLLPVYVYTGTEFGQWAQVEQAVDRLARRLPEVTVHSLLVMGSPRFWRAINGRFISELYQHYGFYSPCPGCHLYLHTARIPLSIRLGNVPIISGERESHTGMIKINQTAGALDFYLDVSAYFSVRLLFPVRHIASGEEIENILQIPWKRGKGQLNCALSENYQRIDSQIAIQDADILRFFSEFAGPAAKKIVESYITGQTPNHNAVAREILTCIP